MGHLPLFKNLWSLLWGLQEAHFNNKNIEILNSSECFTFLQARLCGTPSLQCLAQVFSSLS